MEEKEITWQDYHDHRRASNDCHNAGVQRSIDGDTEGALACFALRDEHEEKIKKIWTFLKKGEP